MGVWAIPSRSGSKDFIEKLAEDGSKGAGEKIIGQFGVGFYSGKREAGQKTNA